MGDAQCYGVLTEFFDDFRDLEVDFFVVKQGTAFDVDGSSFKEGQTFAVGLAEGVFDVGRSQVDGDSKFYQGGAPHDDVCGSPRV